MFHVVIWKKKTKIKSRKWSISFLEKKEKNHTRNEVNLKALQCDIFSLGLWKILRFCSQLARTFIRWIYSVIITAKWSKWGILFGSHMPMVIHNGNAFYDVYFERNKKDKNENDHLILSKELNHSVSIKAVLWQMPSQISRIRLDVLCTSQKIVDSIKSKKIITKINKTTSVALCNAFFCFCELELFGFSAVDFCLPEWSTSKLEQTEINSNRKCLFIRRFSSFSTVGGRSERNKQR